MRPETKTDLAALFLFSVLGVLAALLGLGLIWTVDNPLAPQAPTPQGRITVEHVGTAYGHGIYILVDTKTGVEFLQYREGIVLLSQGGPR